MRRSRRSPERAGDTEQNIRPMSDACESIDCCDLRSGEKTQAGVDPKACCNSPFSYISIMMSEPPMNSPLT